MAPTASELAVATGALRAEAGTWAAQAAAMDGIAAKVGSLGFSGIEAGIFQIIVSTHQELVDHLVARSREASAEMGQVAVTLRSVADTYDDEERRGEHALRNLY